MSQSNNNGRYRISTLSPKLWLYTNFDCNLTCAYCVAESSPRAPRQALGLNTVQKLVNEAASMGFTEVFFTGGEPFMLDDIFDMLAYAQTKLNTTVLSNAMLLHGSRLDRLCAVAGPRLKVQVSLDGGHPEHHDAYRGAGTWAKTVAGIRNLLGRGLRVSLSTTETPANSAHLAQLHAFRRSLGIANEDHFVRPLAKRGFAQEGVEVGPDTLQPEVTVTAAGVYWHPLVSPSSTDMRVTGQIFPLAQAVACIEQQLAAEETARTSFT